ncbi:MAG: hypothetical protein AAF959_20530 [Cyanobacteria bacterium P01_D01_bin.56]
MVSPLGDLEQAVVNHATEAVTKLQQFAENPLDYSPASIVTVEAMLKYLSEEQILFERQIDWIETLVGAYVLEVARREFGGHYYWHDAQERPVLVVGEPSCRIAIMPFGKVKGRLLGDETDNIPFFYDGFAGSARQAEPGANVLYV